MTVMSENAALEDISGLTVSDVMSKDVLTVYEGWSIKRLANFFVKHNISGAPVVASDDELVGVVTQSDVVEFETKTPTEQELERLVQFYCGPYGGNLTKADLEHIREKAIEHCTVNSIMTPKVASIDVSVSAVEACKTLVEVDVHRLFITDAGRLVGVVSAMDFLRKLVASVE